MEEEKNMGFYVLENGERKGPYTIEELRQGKLSPDTLVWTEGETGWRKAGEMPALAGLFPSSIPPVPPAEEAAPRPTMPKTWLVESILVMVLCCLPFGLVGLVYASKVETAYWAKDYAQAARYSRSAKTWTLWGVGVSAGLVVLYLLIVLVAAVAGCALGY